MSQQVDLMNQVGGQTKETKNTSDIYFGKLLQVKDGILTKSEIKFAIIQDKKHWFSRTKYISYPGEFEVFLPVDFKYNRYNSVEKPKELVLSKLTKFVYPKKSKISMKKNHIITAEDENLSFLVDYTKLSNILGDKEITAKELMSFVGRNNDSNKLKEFEELRKKELETPTIARIIKENNERIKISTKQSESKPQIIQSNQEQISPDKIVGSVKKIAFTTFFAALSLVVGVGGINLYKINKNSKFKYEFDVDGNLLATGNAKYDSVKDWNVVEKEMINGEHKLFITSSNFNGDLIDVLKNVKIGNKKSLSKEKNTDEYGIVSVKRLEDYLLAYDMIKAYYTSDDIKELLNKIEKDYYSKTSKVLEK